MQVPKLDMNNPLRLACCMISLANIDQVKNYYRLEPIHDICRLVPPAKSMLSQLFASGHRHFSRLSHGFFVNEEPPLRVLHLLALGVLFVVALDVQSVDVRLFDVFIQFSPPLVFGTTTVLAAHRRRDIVVDAERPLRLVETCELALWCECE